MHILKQTGIKLATILITAIALAGASLPAMAQLNSSNKTLRIFVGYPPGGGSDMVARTVGAKLSQKLDRPVVVENRPGANGTLAGAMVAQSDPDGHTLIMIAADSHSIAPHVYPNIRYDALEDFTYLALIGVQPMALIVRNGVPVTTVQEFIDYAKENGDDMTYASYGVGSSSHVAMAMLEQYGDFKIRHIPYPGSAPALNGVMAGTVDAMMLPTPLAIPNAKGGKVKMIAVASQTELSVAPGEPYFGAQNIPVDASAWVGIMGPANMPDDIVKELNEAFASILQDDELRKSLVITGTEVIADRNTPEQLNEFYTSEYERWGEAVRAAGITAEQ